MKKFYFILTLLCLFSCSLLISFNVFAQDGAPGGSHGSVSYNQKDKTMNFFMDAGQEAGQLFYGLGKDIVDGIDNAYAIYLYQFVDEDDLSLGEKQLINHFCNIDEGNESASVIFDIDDSFNFTLKDEYQSDYEDLMNKLINSINNQYVLYNTYPTSQAMQFMTVDNSNAQVNAYFAVFNDSDYPLYFTRWNDNLAFCSLCNINNDSNINVDGLIYDNGYSWDLFVQNFSTFQNHGYLNDVDNDGNDGCYFLPYANGHYYGNLANYKYSGSDSELHNPIVIRAYDYDYTSWNTDTRSKSAFFSNSGAPIMFFRDTQCYSSFYSNKSAIPLSYSNLNIDIPDNFDYSDFFKNIDDDLIKNTKSLEELYTYLSTELHDSIDRINDTLKDTNSILKEIRDLIGDKWDRTLGKNVLDYLPDIVDKLDDIFWDLHALNPDNVQQLTETILQDSSLENRLKHIFPFGVFQDFKDLSKVLAGVEQKELVFTFTTEHFYWGSDSGETTIEINISELPAFNVVKSMINFFVICLFNYSMARIEFKFISVFFGG